MRLTALDRNKLRILAIVVACSTIGSAFFGVAMGEAGGFLNRSALIGAYNGCLISLLIAGAEIFSDHITLLTWLKRAPFLVNVGLRSVIYLAVLTLVIQSSFEVVGLDAEGWGWRDPNFLITIAWSFGVSVVFNAMVRINQMLGRGVLVKFLTGYYYRPHEEERIFMFLDLAGSTALCGTHRPPGVPPAPERVHSRRNRTIIGSGGEIHDYVGDEIIITWNPKHGSSRAAAFAASSTFAALWKRTAIRTKAATAPFRSPRRASHGSGRRRRNGGRKAGDRVPRRHRKHDRPYRNRVQGARWALLASEELVNGLEASADLSFEDIGPVTLRGRRNAQALPTHKLVQVWTVSRLPGR